MTVLRTMIFVPGYKSSFLEKSKTLDSDALILDLEDSVPLSFKMEARKNIQNFLRGLSIKKKIFVRLNSVESGLLSEDLNYVMQPNIYGFMPSMIRDEFGLIYIDKLLTQLEHDKGFEKGKFKLCPLIETGSAVLKCYEIAKSSSRVIGLAFGAEDYLTDLDGLSKEAGLSILTARSMIVMAARSLKLEAIDTPYLGVHDRDGFCTEAEFSRELGFSGRLILHPDQLKIANNIFTPSDAEVNEANLIISAIEASGLRGEGVTLLDGKLVGPPMERRARKVLGKWREINGLEVDDTKR